MTTLSFSKTTRNAVELPFELVPSEGVTILVLRGRLGVQQARPLWDCLQSALQTGASVQLEAEALDGMDTSIVQILCRAAKGKNPVRVGGVSEGFTNALALRGLESVFALPAAASDMLNKASTNLPANASNKSRTKRNRNA